MAIAVQTVSTTGFAASSTIALTKPTGTVDGDLLVAVIVNEGVQTVSAVPSGWTLLQEDSEANGDFVRVYWKQASSEGASWTWTFNASTERMGGVLRIDGQVPTNPTDQNNETDVQDTRTPSYANAITPTYANSLLVMAIVANDTANILTTGYAIATSNPTWTEHIAMRDNGTGLAILVASGVRPETTSTGNSSATIGSSGTPDSACILMSFIAINNASTNGGTGVITLTGNAGTATGGASVSGGTGTITLTGNAGTATTPDPDWTNQSKSSEGSVTNQAKS